MEGVVNLVVRVVVEVEAVDFRHRGGCFVRVVLLKDWLEVVRVCQGSFEVVGFVIVFVTCEFHVSKVKTVLFLLNEVEVARYNGGVCAGGTCWAMSWKICLRARDWSAPEWR